MNLLSSISNAERDELYVHADLEGLRILEREIRRLREALETAECHHFHLFTEAWNVEGKLTDSMLREESVAGGSAIQHLTFYAWAQEWKQKHELYQQEKTNSQGRRAHRPNKGFNRTPVSLPAAKPVELNGGAG